MCQNIYSCILVHEAMHPVVQMLRQSQLLIHAIQSFLRVNLLSDCYFCNLWHKYIIAIKYFYFF